MKEVKYRWSVYDVLFWFFALLTIVLLIWYMFGQTPGVEILIVALVSSDFLLWRMMYKHGRELERVRGAFGLVRKDMGIMKRDIRDLRSGFSLFRDSVESDLGLIKKKLRIRE